MINPYQNREKSALAIKRGEFLARWTATITTSAGGAIWGYAQAIKYLPEGWGIYSQAIAFIVAIAVAGVLGWITDHAFGDLLQRVVTDAVASRHPNAVQWQGDEYFKRLRKIESVGFFVVLLALFSFDAYTTIIIRDPVADQARKNQLRDIAAATDSISGAQEAAMSPIKTQIQAMKSDIWEAQKAVEKNNPALIQLTQNGNSWARQQLAAKKSKATRALEKQLNELTTRYNESLGAHASNAATTAQLINNANAAAAAQNERNRAVMAGMYTAMSFGPKILSIILRVLMVITFFAYSSQLSLDLNGDGIIDYADVEVYYARLVNERNEKRAAAAQRASAAAKTDFDDIGTAGFR